MDNKQIPFVLKTSRMLHYGQTAFPMDPPPNEDRLPAVVDFHDGSVVGERSTRITDVKHETLDDN
jgi:hypothetical protein